MNTLEVWSDIPLIYRDNEKEKKNWTGLTIHGVQSIQSRFVRVELYHRLGNSERISNSQAIPVIISTDGTIVELSRDPLGSGIDLELHSLDATIVLNERQVCSGDHYMNECSINYRQFIYSVTTNHHRSIVPEVIPWNLLRLTRYPRLPACSATCGIWTLQSFTTRRQWWKGRYHGL